MHAYKINRFEFTLDTLRLSSAGRITCQVSSVKCQVDAIGDVQSGIFSFVPIDGLLISRDGC